VATAPRAEGRVENAWKKTKNVAFIYVDVRAYVSPTSRMNGWSLSYAIY